MLLYVCLLSSLLALAFGGGRGPRPTPPPTPPTPAPPTPIPTTLTCVDVDVCLYLYPSARSSVDASRAPFVGYATRGGFSAAACTKDCVQTFENTGDMHVFQFCDSMSCCVTRVTAVQVMFFVVFFFFCLLKN
jgi:hypothetical protein